MRRLRAVILILFYDIKRSLSIFWLCGKLKRNNLCLEAGIFLIAAENAEIFIKLIKEMIKKEKKKKIIEKFKLHKDDTGSAEVQVAVLTERIKELTEHLKINKKDNHSRRGLLKMVAKRKKLLKDIENESEERFAKIVQALKLKEAKALKNKTDKKDDKNDKKDATK